MLDIIVAGAGPAGCFAAEKLASRGLAVELFEEHGEIGLPQHCTGIVSQKFLDHFEVPGEFIQEKISTFTVISPSGERIRAPGKVKAMVIKRAAFDQYLAGKAVEAGARLHLSSKVTAVRQGKDHLAVEFEDESGKKAVDARLCILATGSMSLLPARNGVGPGSLSVSSIQAEAEIMDIEGAELYLGRRFAAGSFAYAVSTGGGRSKVGIIGAHGVHRGFSELLASSFLKERMVSMADPDHRKMPLGLACRTVHNRVVAVGDAAGQVKTTTGGGLYYGLLCSDILCDVLLKARERNDFNLQRVSEYDRRWKHSLGREIRIGLLLRKFMEIVSDRDLSAICSLLAKKPFSDILESQVDFDFHQHFLSSLIKVPEFQKGFIATSVASLRKLLLKG